MFTGSSITFLVLLHTISAQWNTNDFMKREHSLVKPYHSGSMTIPNWDVSGFTMVSSNYIRLTPDEQSRSGMIWNSIPVQSRNWELHVQFKVHGKGKDLFGDGFAIWYARDRLLPGTVFGNNDYFHGLAIILDTYSNHNGAHNHQHPYISGMVNNGTLHYDHDRDGTHTQIAGCEAKFRNLDFDTYLSIRYENDVLTVSTDIENKANWKQCFQVSSVRLPTGYYFGMSATTGQLTDNHDILSVKMYELDLPNDPQTTEDRAHILPSAAYFEPPRDHVDDPKPSTLGGFKLFLLMLVGAVVIVTCVVLGIMFYQQQQDKRKRLY